MSHFEFGWGMGRGGGNPNVLVPYLGLVATRSRILLQRVAVATTAQAVTRSRHKASDDISAIQMAYTGWCVTSGVETGSGGNTTVFCSIEYPVGSLAVPGTRTRVTWTTGNPSIVVPSSGTRWSDLTTLGFTIPRGDEFYVWTFVTTASGFMSYSNHAIDTANGEGTQKAASGLTDVTLVGTITPNDGSMWVGPQLIVGSTTRRSVIAVGDSRVNGGAGDSMDASGDLGEICRSLGAYNVGYANHGSPGGDASDLVADHTRQQQLWPYCSDLWFQYGQNDFSAGASLATMQTRATTMRGYALTAGKRPHSSTIAPQTTGAWTLADGSDQTTAASFAQREPFNDWLRAGSLGSIVHDLASVQEVTDTGKWKADGTPQKYTVDGIHATQFALLAIVSAQTISPTWFLP